MKIGLGVFFFLFSSLSFAVACRCNCYTQDKLLCAPAYDVDKPCVNACLGTSGFAPMAKTACYTQRVFNRGTGEYEWHSTCME